MNIIQNGCCLKDGDRAAVLAIGNFDGVHLGHQAVLKQTAQIARATNQPFGAITFEPHPRTYFRPAEPVFRLTPLAVKARLMQALGLDLLSVLTFNSDLAAMTAREFVEKILVRQHGISHIVCGYDFCFGHKRQGDVPFLQQMGAEYNFAVTVINPVLMAKKDHENEPYSSSVIREKLRQGNMPAAAELLGYWWQLSGLVVEGDKFGRTIRYPTANLSINQGGWPHLGIYAVRITIEGEEKSRDGVAYIGDRPTFNKEGIVVEVHLFDFADDLYGKNLNVEFIAFIRPDATFETPDELVQRMDEDASIARKILADMRVSGDPMSKFELGAIAGK